MQCSVAYDQEMDYSLASCEGIFNLATIKKYARKIVETAEEHGCKRLLNDLRDVQLDVDTMDIFKSPEVVQMKGIDRHWQRAVVVAEEYEKDFHFFETVAVNNGHLMKVFVDYQSAVEWLKE